MSKSPDHLARSRGRKSSVADGPAFSGDIGGRLSRKVRRICMSSKRVSACEKDETSAVERSDDREKARLICIVEYNQPFDVRMLFQRIHG